MYKVAMLEPDAILRNLAIFLHMLVFIIFKINSLQSPTISAILSYRDFQTSAIIHAVSGTLQLGNYDSTSLQNIMVIL